METPVKQNVVTSRFPSVPIILFPLIVAFSVCFAIVARWRAYDWVGKFLGIVLILGLLIDLLGIILKLRKGEKDLDTTPYAWLLLATLLFNR